MRQRPTLEHRDAVRALDAVKAKLEEGELGAAIAICDEYGELVAFLRTDGCALPSVEIAMNKAYTAARVGKPSKALGESSRSGQFPTSNFGGLRYIGFGGGVPIEYEGALVGAIGISGLQEHEDIELAELAISVLADAAADSA